MATSEALTLSREGVKGTFGMETAFWITSGPFKEGCDVSPYTLLKSWKGGETKKGCNASICAALSSDL
jgi:hypothetical protein